MTIIELMVSIALSAILVSALVGVLRGVKQQAELANKYDNPVWPARSLELFRRDLLAASSIWLEDETIWMQTDAPSYESGNAGLRRVGYGIQPLRNAPPLLERIDENASATLAIGPSRIVVERIDSEGQPQPLPAFPGPVPNQVRVWIFGENADEVYVVQDLVVR